MTEIWKHWPEYAEARAQVQAQTLEQDLATIDALFGRDNLRYGAPPEEVKAEALRQTEIEFRSERNEAAEFHLAVAQPCTFSSSFLLASRFTKISRGTILAVISENTRLGVPFWVRADREPPELRRKHTTPNR